MKLLLLVLRAQHLHFYPLLIHILNIDANNQLCGYPKHTSGFILLPYLIFHVDQAQAASRTVYICTKIKLFLLTLSS